MSPRCSACDWMIVGPGIVVDDDVYCDSDCLARAEGR
jgi:hypothetical protein